MSPGNPDAIAGSGVLMMIFENKNPGLLTSRNPVPMHPPQRGDLPCKADP